MARVRRKALIAAVLGALLSAAPLHATPLGPGAGDQLPNLVPLPLFDLRVDPTAEGPLLRFAAAVANRGDYALDLLGHPDTGGIETAAVEQCTSWAAPKVCIGRSPVGRFVWHPDHGHYHFEDFALYELRRLRKNMMPNMKPKGLIATSGKVSFCVIDYEQDDDSADPSANPLYYSCASPVGFQGISPGWRDVYSRGLPGQELLIGGVADGDYALIVVADPTNRLYESSDDDNVATVGLRIIGGVVTRICESRPGTLLCDQRVQN